MNKSGIQLPQLTWNHKFLERLRIVLLPFLLLTTPFFTFLSHHSYCVTCPEVLVSLIGLVLVGMLCSAMMLAGWHGLNSLILTGLLLWFLDLQVDWLNELNKYALTAVFLGLLLMAWAMKENFSVITTVFLLTFFLVSMTKLLFASEGHPLHFKWTVPVARDVPPRLIHIILDEHIGIEGIPTDRGSGGVVKDELDQFYQKHGFRLFGGAYSHYYSTTDSVSNLVNFSASDEANSFIIGRKEPYTLSDNRYFQTLSERGYAINILQSTYLHYCAERASLYENCLEYNSYSLQPIQHLSVPVSHHLQVLLHTYFQQSYRYKRFRGIYRDIQPTLVRWGAPIPAWTWDVDAIKVRTHSINSLQLLDELWKDIESMPAGNALLVHLLLPHYPYVSYDDCSIRNSILEWKRPVSVGPNQSTTPESRREQYEHYFQQIQCLYTKLEELFQRMRASGIYDDTIIVLHGDHGSRIMMNVPTVENREVLEEQDIIDGFSTLFAVKLPGVDGASDASPQPLEKLLEDVLLQTGTTTVGTVSEQSEPYVYLKSKNQKKLVSIPYPVSQEQGLEP